jgi:hypothetical protein
MRDETLNPVRTFFCLLSVELCNQSDQLISSERQHTKHEMAHYLGGTSDTNHPPAELIL